MPERISIFVEEAPAVFGHYSQVIKFGNQLFISGTLPLDRATNKLVSPDAGEQARQVYKHLTVMMQACQGALSNIMHMHLYLVDLRDHRAVDEVSKEFFFFTPPARTTLQVAALPFGARVMVDAVADLNPPSSKPGMMI